METTIIYGGYIRGYIGVIRRFSVMSTASTKEMCTS